MTHTETKPLGPKRSYAVTLNITSIERGKPVFDDPTPPTVSVEAAEQIAEQLIEKFAPGCDEDWKKSYARDIQPIIDAHDKEIIALAKQQEADRIRKAIDTDTFDVYCGIKGLEVATGTMKSGVYRLMAINLNEILGDKKLEE